MFSGDLPLIAKPLALAIWEPIGKLSYGAYMYHLVILQVYVAQVPESLQTPTVPKTSRISPYNGPNPPPCRLRTAHNATVVQELRQLLSFAPRVCIFGDSGPRVPYFVLLLLACRAALLGALGKVRSRSHGQGLAVIGATGWAIGVWLLYFELPLCCS